jgi:hypothetical protein
MSKKVRVGQQVVICDQKATVGMYGSAATVAGADVCSCTSCRNFAAQRGSAYPDEFLALLKQLGADPLKELEAFDYDSSESSARHLYGGWFVFYGEIVEGSDWRPEQKPGFFAYWFTNSFPAGQRPEGVKACAVEFCTEMPWVIPEVSDRPKK